MRDTRLTDDDVCRVVVQSFLSQSISMDKGAYIESILKKHNVMYERCEPIAGWLGFLFAGDGRGSIIIGRSDEEDMVVQVTKPILRTVDADKAIEFVFKNLGLGGLGE